MDFELMKYMNPQIEIHRVLIRLHTNKSIFRHNETLIHFSATWLILMKTGNYLSTNTKYI